MGNASYSETFSPECITTELYCVTDIFSWPSYFLSNNPCCQPKKM